MCRRKWMSLIAVFVLTGSLLSGCGSKESSEEAYVSEESYATGDMYMEDVATTEAMEPSTAVEKTAENGDAAVTAETGTAPSVSENRKLIKNVYLTVETENFEELNQNISDKVTSLGGYMQNASVSGKNLYSDSYRYASYVIRIPKDKLDSFVTEVSKISNVTNKTESTDDITLQYVDMESQKQALTIEYDRLTALLEQADTLETIIALESRLTEVRYQLQSMESQLRTYHKLVDYATNTVEVTEDGRLTPVEVKTPFQKMISGFQTSVYNVATGIRDFFIGFVIAIPYLFVLAVVILIFAIIVKIVIKKTEKKNAKQKEKTNAMMQQNVQNTNFGVNNEQKEQK